MEREERERHRAEAARAKEDAKRYPMEDLELLLELQQKAAEEGEALRLVCVVSVNSPSSFPTRILACLTAFFFY